MEQQIIRYQASGSTEIERIMTDLGVRYDQAYRMVRQRADMQRNPRSYPVNSNWLK